MRPFRSRLMAAIVTAIVAVGLFGSVANADDISIAANSAAPSAGLHLSGTGIAFPEDPWWLPSPSFPEDPWPGI